METLTYISARSYLSVNSILELPNERSMLSVYAFGYFTNHEGVDGLQSSKRGYSGPNFHGLEAPEAYVTAARSYGVCSNKNLEGGVWVVCSYFVLELLLDTHLCSYFTKPLYDFQPQLETAFTYVSCT